MEDELLQQIGWLWVPLAWLVALSFVLLVAMVRGLPQTRWLLMGFLLAPVALIISFFPRLWLLPLGLAEPERKTRQPSLTIPPEKLLAGKALVGEVRDLRKRGRLQDAAELLQALIEVAEEKAREAGSDVPFWYYDELARVCHAQKDVKRERQVLERFLARTTGSTPKISLRFEKRLAQL